jgi:GNAT superfamily N-acetyltransferase
MRSTEPRAERPLAAQGSCMSIQIRSVDPAAPEALDIYRLRYEVYVAELGRTQEHADHVQRTIREPLDHGSVLLAAYDMGQLVGSVRLSYARCVDLGDYVSLYRMREAGSAHPAQTSITTKLLVAPAYRNGPLGYRLSVATYCTALSDGISHDFIDVYPARLAFFERLGYVRCGQIVHAEYGEVTLMRLDLRDASHLRAVNSPFVRYLVRELGTLAPPAPPVPEARRHRVA